MNEVVNYGFISILPSLIAVILAFITRNTLISLGLACFIGVFLSGQGIFGFPNLLKHSVGTSSFAWVMLLNTLIAILVAFFRKTGAMQGFTKLIENKNPSRKMLKVIAWILGIFVYFSDSFSPLFVGTVMRDLTDKAKISREKLSYIADSGAAPVSVLVPITGWAAFLSGLAVGIANIDSVEKGLNLFVKAIPFNLYALITVIFVGLISAEIIPDFGPMKKAEKRSLETGKVIREDGEPMLGKELTEMPKFPNIKTRVFLNFILPVILIITFAIGTYIFKGSAKTMEAFLYVMILMIGSMLIQKVPLKEITDTMLDGIKGSVPAVSILAMAYSLNSLSKELGTASYIVEHTKNFMTPHTLPAIIFLIAAIIAFATGSSWGTFAIAMPIALPLAFQFSNGEITLLVLACFSAVAGGGVFGDHCSPLSDTTILASTGAGSDHIDHVKTQLPYALICGGLSLIIYLIIGFTML